jgi:hypothetical protein
VTHPSLARRLAAGTLSLCLAGTVLSTVGAAEAREARQAQAPTVRVWVTKYHNIKMPTQLRPGVHRFVVRSRKAAGFQIVRPHAGYTKSELSRDAMKIFESPKALKRFERNVDLVAGVSSRRGEPGVMWTRLPRGHYWVVDTNPDRALPRKMLDLRVSGPRLHGTLPGRATLRAVNEADFAPNPKSIPGSGRLVLRNNSVDNHFFGISKLLPGKTMKDFKAWLDDAMNGGNSAPPVSFDVGLDTGVVGPGRAMSLKYDLPPGRYVMTCWWPDAEMGNMPHVFMGMYRGLRVR